MGVISGIEFNTVAKEKELNFLIELWKEKNKELEEIVRKLPETIPEIKELKDGNYVINYDIDIWDIDTMCKFLEAISELYPNSSFSMLPAIDLVELTDEENKVLNNILNRIKEKIK